MILFSCQKTVPGNVYVFNGYLSMLNQKDMYPTDEIFEKMFDFGETDSPIEHFETLGYEGSNFIEMTGSLIINIIISILTAMVVNTVFYFILKCLTNKCARMIGARLKTNNTIGAILMIYLQGFLEMLICVVLSLS
jgi:hypothetical protein